MHHRRSLSLLLSCAILSLGALAGVRSAELGPTAENPGLDLPAPVHGIDAIRVLGDRLDQIAALNRFTPQGLRETLLENRDLWVDTAGRLVYVCSNTPPQAAKGARFAGRTANGGVFAPPYPTTETFKLHSRNSKKKIYLDFDGHVTPAGTGWNNGQQIDSTPLDLDGNGANWSVAEHELIQKTWQRSTEAFAPFDVDVTTEDPGVEALKKTGPSDEEYGIRVVISPTSSWAPASAGGIAFLTSFNWAQDIPCFTFSDRQGNDEHAIALTNSHEVGHTLGLSHDGQNGGVEYYGGQGNWGPIMGAPFGKALMTWSDGDYTNANNKENDVAIMPNFGAEVMVDDHADTIANATNTTGTTVQTSGIIASRTDVDVFKFETGNGPVVLSATNWDLGANVDLKMDLLSESGTVITSSDTVNLNANITTNLTPGVYYVRIDGVGAGDPLNGGYSDYGSLGFYRLSLSIQTAIPPAAPSRLTATAVSSSRIDLSWTDNSINEALFEIERKSGGGNFAKIGTARPNVTTFQDPSVTSGVTYTYQVRAVNAAGNSAYSNEASATPPYDPPSAPVLASVTVAGSSIIDVAWSKATGFVDSYDLQRKGPNGSYQSVGSFSASVATHRDTGLPADTTQTYRLRAVGPGGSSEWSNELSATLPPAAPSGLTASSLSGAVGLSWTHSNPNAGFRIERSVANGPFTQVAEIGAGNRSYTDRGFLANVTVTYQVRAFTISGQSDPSNPASATTLPALTHFTFQKSTVAGGKSVQATVQIQAPAPAGGSVISLSGDTRVLVLPSTVTIKEGKTSATFSVKTRKIKPATTTTATATYAGASQQASITVTK